MPKDLRDPWALGLSLLAVKARNSKRLSGAYDSHREYLECVQRYDANPGTIEKYGRPQDLPPTPF